MALQHFTSTLQPFNKENRGNHEPKRNGGKTDERTTETAIASMVHSAHVPETETAYAAKKLGRVAIWQKGRPEMSEPDSPTDDDKPIVSCSILPPPQIISHQDILIPSSEESAATSAFLDLRDNGRFSWNKATQAAFGEGKTGMFYHNKLKKILDKFNVDYSS